MRKYRSGLCTIVDLELGINLYTDSLFVFSNRRQTIIRFLYWDATGFAVWTKTLEKSRYRWPRIFGGDVSKKLSYQNLEKILLGMDITPHKKLGFKKVS